MHEASCGSMMSATIDYYSLFVFYLSFSVCSGSMREASCGSMMSAIIIHSLLLFFN
jgi:hypothetical protein